MRRTVLIAALLTATSPAFAQEPEVLRLACRAEGSPQGFAFSIDLGAKDAVETVSGRRYAVAGLRDHLILSDQTGTAFRIDRITGAFAVEKQLRLEGMCDKVDRKF